MSVEPLDLVRPLEGWLAEHEEDLIALRRQLHANPELGGREIATTELVGERLRLAGLEPRVLQSGTGLICDLDGRDAALPRLAFRADLDALAMDDEKDTHYRSRVPGVAHACGHDVHTAVVLGTALYLAHRRDELPGPLRFIFQPAEEAVPGGALLALHDGALEGVGAILGLHCDPKLEAGRIGLKSGAISSAADMAAITLTGPGGHTARPEATVDMISLASHIVAELPGRVAGRAGEPASVRVGFGMIRAGDAANVIPTHANLLASVRTPSVEVWERLPAAFEAALASLLDGTGAEHELDYTNGVPPVVNDPSLTDIVRGAAEAELGSHAVTPARQSWGGDDFAWYARQVPACFFRVGVGDPAGRRPPLDLHTGAFDVDESAIAIALRVLVAASTDYFIRGPEG